MATQTMASRPAKPIDHLSEVAPGKSRRAVPKHLLFLGFPKDVNSFIRDIYPNLLLYTESKLPNIPNRRQYVEDVVQGFVQYILSDSTKKDAAGSPLPRWKTYDLVRFPEMAYHKWFIHQLYWFILSYQKGIFTELKDIALAESVEGERPAKGVLVLEHHRSGEDHSADQMHSSLTVKLAEEFVETISRTYVHHTDCFEKHAYMLYQYCIVQDLTVAEMAAKFNLPNATVSGYRDKLHSTLRVFWACGWNALNTLRTSPRLPEPAAPSKFGTLPE